MSDREFNIVVAVVFSLLCVGLIAILLPEDANEPGMTCSEAIEEMKSCYKDLDYIYRKHGHVASVERLDQCLNITVKACE